MRKLLITGLVALIAVLILGVAFYYKISQKPAISLSVPIGDHQPLSNESTSSSLIKSYQYSGRVLAGHRSFLYDFNQADFNEGLKTNKAILLFFYKNDSSLSQDELKKVYSAFDKLSTDQVIGFRVNFFDSDTDQDEKNLAKIYQVNAETTKILIKNNQPILETTDPWSEEKYLQILENQY